MEEKTGDEVINLYNTSKMYMSVECLRKMTMMGNVEYALDPERQSNVGGVAQSIIVTNTQRTTEEEKGGVRRSYAMIRCWPLCALLFVIFSSTPF